MLYIYMVPLHRNGFFCRAQVSIRKACRKNSCASTRLCCSRKMFPKPRFGCGMNIICILCVSVYVYYVITIYDIYIYIHIYIYICRWYMCIQIYTCGVHRCVYTNKYPHHRADSHHQQESTGSLRYSKSLLLVHQCQRLTGKHVQTPQAFSCFWCFWFMVGRKRNKTNLIGKMMIRPYFGSS